MLDESGSAVTWGVFPGQEVAQSTIIERDSFLAWKVRRLEQRLLFGATIYCRHSP